MPFIDLRRLGAIASVSTLCLVSAPAARADVSSVYPPQSEARDFAAGQGGWAASTSFESCPLPLTCPTVANTFEAAGGAAGDGHVRSSFEATLAIVGAANAVWESPAFPYTGAGGQAPTSLSLAVSRRADVTDLLEGIAGSAATYSVALIDETGGGAVIPVAGPTSLATATEWAAVPTAVDPGLLTLGNEYAIRITSTYVPGAVAALVEGSADYDNVVLTATRPDDSPKGPGPGGGAGGSGGAGGAGGVGAGSSSQASLTADRLRVMIRRSAPAAARLRGKYLLVRLACPRSVRQSCRITAQGRIRKRVPVTHRRTVRVAKGRNRLVALRVKPRFRERIAKRKRLQIFQIVRVGDVSATFSRSRALIRIP